MWISSFHRFEIDICGYLQTYLKVIIGVFRTLIHAFVENKKDGVALSLDNSWRITVDHRMHNSCWTCAYQLLCKCTTAVVRPTILTVSTTYSVSSNNISCLFQQHILSLPTK